MEFEDPVLARIVAFLESIGIEVLAEPVADSFLPGIAVRNGVLVFDPAMPWPGDLLHEAGHIAVTDPALRPTLNEVPDDAGDEMAAIAWSYAAALEAGVDPALVFHEGGYRGASQSLLDAFGGGGWIGMPMLQYYGMTAEPQHAERLGLPVYPAMGRWLR
jgi:hypothetical protein